MAFEATERADRSHIDVPPSERDPLRDACEVVRNLQNASSVWSGSLRRVPRRLQLQYSAQRAATGSASVSMPL